MRLICADSLKRKVQKESTQAWKMQLKANVDVVLNQFIDWIDEAPTVGGWISVKDRLPEEGERVLILSKYGHISDAELHERGGGLMEFDPLGYVVGEHVKYWMPLPKPPKEDENVKAD